MNKSLKIISVVLVLTAMAIGSSVVYFSIAKKNEIVVPVQEEVVKSEEVTQFFEEEETVEEINEEEAVINPVECDFFQERVDETEGEIEVDWVEGWATTSPDVIFDDNALEIIDNCFYNDSSYSDLNLDIYFKEVYEKGVILSGPYKGNKLYYAFVRGDGPYFRTPFYRLIKTDDEIIYLSEYSDKLWKGLDRYFIANDSIIIGDMDLPEKINIFDNDIGLVLKDDNFEKITEDAELMFSQDNFLLKKYNGCFFAVLADGTGLKYKFDVELFNVGTIDIDTSGFSREDTYIISNRTACGTYASCYNYAEELAVETMKNIGKDSRGFAFYQSEEGFEDLYKVYYPGYQKEKISYDDFLNDYPVIYWQDPFGGYLRAQKAKYQSGAECGKPVIYLYPEQEQDISVWVEPNGGFTITEPVYNNGWRVKADTESNIYNYDDKETYPYLFWEGHANNYRMEDEGFVVARDEVEKFLIDSLTKLGLIQKEYDEFIEFWLPKMQAREYYFISFLPQEKFEKIAPLTVSPKPDTVIRVFMDYMELDQKINVNPQRLTAPERKGFTVVEWGGALHR